MHLHQIKLGSCFKLKHGFAFKGEHFSDYGYFIVTTPGNFYDQGGFKPKSGKEKYYTGPIPNGFVLSKGDLIVAMTEQKQGLLGSSALIPEDNQYLHNQRLGLVTGLNENILDKMFLYNLFNTQVVRDQIQASANGAKVRHTSPSRIYEVEVTIPDLHSQKKIASILSAYDDLIENNTRRIEILEEMARRLYEEWFVRFRFPGHKEASFVETEIGLVPKGWEVRTIQDYIELAYGKALKKEHRVDGPYPVYGSSGVVGNHVDYLVEGPGIIIGRKGNVGSVHWTDQSFYPIDTVFYVKTELPLEYVFFNLQRQNFINNDAAVPGLNRNQAYALPFIRPSDEHLEAFKAHCATTYKGIRLLERKNTNLRAQRDLLLPKLISGQIDVAQAEEMAKEETAA